MLLLLSAMLTASVAGTTTPPPVELQNNERAAGQVSASGVAVRLVAELGTWHPKGARGPALTIAAFGEEGRGLSVPGPLVRVREGTTIVLTLRNALADELRVFGLCSRPGPCAPLTVPAGESRDARFVLSAPGTYHYWGSTTARTLTSRPRLDSQLGGAIVVDPRDGVATDRILVVSMYLDGPPTGACGLQSVSDDLVLTINGASWPHTARFQYRVGDVARWRIVNLSCDQHAMHLHGFHFTVDSTGDGIASTPLAPDEQRVVVTESLNPGRTFGMSWTPTRAGNWLFHCHMVPHMTAKTANAHVGHDEPSHAGMAGLVVGIEVTGAAAASEPAWMPARKLSLILREEPGRYGDAPGYRMDVQGADAPRLDPGPVPGPILFLHRNEPTEITVVNQMKEPSAIHWHGMEIDSYFDGVPGFGGKEGRIAAPIAAGESFIVQVTPPRAGTFIYHTHWHDEAQLAGGLYGPLIVLEPGERFDPETDHVAVIGLNGRIVKDAREPFALNGQLAPRPIRMRAGVANRLRLINITATNVGLVASVRDRSEQIDWKPLAKDGASLPHSQSGLRPARQPIAVGETYDFEIGARPPQRLWLEVRRANGEWVLQAPIDVR